VTRTRAIALQFATTAVILAVLWRYTQSSDSIAVAKFDAIWAAFRDDFLFDRIGSDVVPTLRRIAIGFGLSVLIGFAIGMMLGHSRLMRLLSGPTFAFIRAIPPVSLIPPAIVLIGIEENMKISLVVFVCIWPVALNTAAGVVEIDQTAKDTSRVYRLTRWERLRWLTLPAIGPRVFAGMSTSLAFAMIGVIVTEYLVGTEGLGAMLNQVQQQYSIPEMWAVILMLGLLGFSLSALLTRTRNRVLFWVRTDNDR
jgi:ABC-type nitrate/sulfonate/bicarbonate transport system permease component